MASTSKSNQQKPRNLENVPEWKTQCHETRNWLDLPSDVMGNILYRIGVCDILENAQKVCTTWRNICKDPAMWRVVCMDYFNSPRSAYSRLQKMCKIAVDRSNGQLIDISIVGFVNEDLIQYVADRASQLRRLEVICNFGERYRTWTEALKKFPLLEELSLFNIVMSKQAIENVARYCPLLKVLNVNQDSHKAIFSDKLSIAIGENLHELRHLGLIGHNLSNNGLWAILNGCCHLKSLDLRACLGVELKGDLLKRCSQQIKSLRKPNDSLEDCPYISENESDYDDDPPWMYGPTDDFIAFYIDYCRRSISQLH